MFQSTLIFNLGFFTAAVLLVYLVVKAFVEACQARWNADVGNADAEGSWGWWVELTTANPGYRYYFGPFASATEAETSQVGFVQDLTEEGAKAIAVKVTWCRPQQLTSLLSESGAEAYCA